jgi:hypothetical protein
LAGYTAFTARLHDKFLRPTGSSAHLVRDEGAAGSNPATPTNEINDLAIRRFDDSHGGQLREQLGMNKPSGAVSLANPARL